MRLDKLLSNLGYGTRSEIKKMCKPGPGMSKWPNNKV